MAGTWATIVLLAACASRGPLPTPPASLDGAFPPLGVPADAVISDEERAGPPGTSSTGAIRGEILGDREPLAGAVLVATSPSLPNMQVAITDEHGAFEIPALPPGTYQVTVFYDGMVLEHAGVVVRANRHIAERITHVRRRKTPP